MKEPDLEQWLKDNRHRINVGGIEQEIGCPATTLSQVFNGRKVPRHWRQPLFDLIKSMRLPANRSSHIVKNT